MQKGVDGVGRQLYGLFSLLILHGVGEYAFDAYSFFDRPFRFQHLDEAQSAQCKEYMIEIVKQFARDKNPVRRTYAKTQHPHELEYIRNPSEDILYTADNAFHFERFKMTPEQITLHRANIELMRHYFINKKLPPNRLPEKCIVMHIRLGDAMLAGRGTSINNYNAKILLLIDRLKIQYPEHHYMVHSDGDVTDIIERIGTSYTLCEKATHILQVLSDFIHSRIFICGNSTLSKVCTFMGDKELTIIHDDNWQSVPENVYKISTYLRTQNLQTVAK